MEFSASSKADLKSKELQIMQNFDSLFLTIIWFLEHDPYTNSAMNLDVNYLKVKQENFKASRGTDKDIYDAITVKNGDTFQNTPILLLFYEKRYKSDIPKNDLKTTLKKKLPEVSSL